MSLLLAYLNQYALRPTENEEFDRSNNITVEQVTKDIYNIQQNTSQNFFLTGIIERDLYNNFICDAINNLMVHGFINYDKDSDEISLTNGGKLFGKSLRFPSNVSKYLKDKLVQEEKRNKLTHLFYLPG